MKNTGAHNFSKRKLSDTLFSDKQMALKQYDLFAVLIHRFVIY